MPIAALTCVCSLCRCRSADVRFQSMQSMIARRAAWRLTHHTGWALADCPGVLAPRVRVRSFLAPKLLPTPPSSAGAGTGQGTALVHEHRQSLGQSFGQSVGHESQGRKSRGQSHGHESAGQSVGHESAGQSVGRESASSLDYTFPPSVVAMAAMCPNTMWLSDTQTGPGPATIPCCNRSCWRERRCPEATAHALWNTTAAILRRVLGRSGVAS
jgi:hypothetical protein